MNAILMLAGVGIMAVSAAVIFAALSESTAVTAVA